jgi:hypothetical protein
VLVVEVEAVIAGVDAGVLIVKVQRRAAKVESASTARPLRKDEKARRVGIAPADFLTSAAADLDSDRLLPAGAGRVA